MLRRLSQLMRSEDFAPGTEVFPDIDVESIAKRLKLEEVGRARGQDNLPASSESSFDSVEMRVVGEIETLRRRGLQQFEDHLRVYRERLSRATEVRKEVEIVAGTAQGDFLAEVGVWKSRFVNYVERLQDAFAWRNAFRQKHRLIRPADEFPGWLKTLALGMLLLLVETGLNGYLFAQKNLLGLLGGILAALLVSISNVGVSGIAGYFARNLHHRNLFMKLIGLAVVLGWLGYAAGFNLAVAHFRDGVEHSGDWTLAAEQAVPALLATPLEIASIESWLLLIIGCLISFLAFLKGLHTDDPYPGYGKVHRTLVDARNAYSGVLETAIGELERKRDLAIDELRDAHDDVRDGIGEAIDALFGASSLKSQVSSFLEQCDVKTAHLLAIYRDANKASRSTDSPPSFALAHSFAAFEPAEEDEKSARRTNAEKEARKVGELVDKTIRDIFEAYETSVRAYREIDDIQGTRGAPVTVTKGEAPPGEAKPEEVTA